MVFFSWFFGLFSWFKRKEAPEKTPEYIEREGYRKALAPAIEILITAREKTLARLDDSCTKKQIDAYTVQCLTEYLSLLSSVDVSACPNDFLSKWQEHLSDTKELIKPWKQFSKNNKKLMAADMRTHFDALDEFGRRSKEIANKQAASFCELLDFSDKYNVVKESVARARINLGIN